MPFWNQDDPEIEQSALHLVLFSFRTRGLETKIFTLGEWHTCRGLAVVAYSGVWTLGFNKHS